VASDPRVDQMALKPPLKGSQQEVDSDAARDKKTYLGEGHEAQSVYTGSIRQSRSRSFMPMAFNLISKARVDAPHK